MVGSMWLRHEVNEWHYQCEILSGKHDYVAKLVRTGNGLMFSILGEKERQFSGLTELNNYLAKVGIEQLPELPP